MDLIRINKAKGMKFYGLAVSREATGVSSIIDSMWLWDEKRHLCFELYGSLAQ